MKTQTDTPYRRTPSGGWQLYLSAGRRIEWGHSFDSERGYRVFLAFLDSHGKNTMDADTVRKLTVELLAGNDDTKHLAAQMLLMADQVDALNRGWVAAGRPRQPLDASTAGRA